MRRETSVDQPEVWVVVDQKKGKMVRADDYTYPKDKLARDAKEANDTEACPVPEEAVESILAHYESFGELIETKTIDEVQQDSYESYVW